MPATIGDIPIPEPSPHFLALRHALRRACPDGGLAVGCSGGPDSLALVAAAVAETPQVHALIIDHGLQQDHAAVAATAAATARRLGAEAEIIPVTVPAAAVARGGVEAAARAVRLDALTARAAALGLDVGLAHTQDDLAENQLISSLRGQPNSMRPVSVRGPVVVRRPFLGVRRADTTGAMKELGVDYWDDPMNSDPSFLRVAIRRQIIPQLAAVIGGDPVAALARAAAIGADNAGFVAAAAEKQLAELTDTDGRLSVTLACRPEPLRRAVIAAWLTGHAVAVSAKKLAAIDYLLTDWHGQGPVAVGKAGAGRRLVVTRKGGKLAVAAGGPSLPAAPAPGGRRQLPDRPPTPHPPLNTTVTKDQPRDDDHPPSPPGTSQRLRR
ncbi:tRNA lysidine(34) synthetase TilS [Corynebacterium mendelii]|uniref:tRNA(Ile)-lysidine synthase n=1 Tax=Corynebacterium mendelii TaxID=2765362 RepID=A0A939IWA8_9CORY|nr:tRNA lysidine(34) synthetase TilS [Corynebacterium mendelii]MBN9645096.1 tRNA lysidine(34) synthetase TilS [Corynebacterium mendelii]